MYFVYVIILRIKAYQKNNADCKILDSNLELKETPFDIFEPLNNALERRVYAHYDYQKEKKKRKRLMKI